jgi:hypothetical protein
MSAAQHLALIKKLIQFEFARELLIKDIILIEYNIIHLKNKRDPNSNLTERYCIKAILGKIV